MNKVKDKSKEIEAFNVEYRALVVELVREYQRAEIKQTTDHWLSLEGLGVFVESPTRFPSRLHRVADMGDFRRCIRSKKFRDAQAFRNLPFEVKTECQEGRSVSPKAFYFLQQIHFGDRPTSELHSVPVVHIVFEQNRPVLEAYHVGQIEGVVLEYFDALKVLMEIWQQPPNYVPRSGSVRFDLGYLKNLVRFSRDTRNDQLISFGLEVIACLAGLYAAFLRHEPHEAVRQITARSSAAALYHALWLIGFDSNAGPERLSDPEYPDRSGEGSSDLRFDCVE